MNEILKIENQLCFRLYAVSRKMTKLYQPLLEKHNLTYPQYIVMLVMFEHQLIDFNELSKIVQLKTGTLTPIINKLVKVGYINKKTNESDKRKIFISLTEKGIELNKVIVDVPMGLANDLPITEEMYHVLVKELDNLSKILSNSIKINKENG